ncbi:MAG TPA: PQQ-binding-like beta-propeller repeat protein [Bacteroidales bacterium]
MMIMKLNGRLTLIVVIILSSVSISFSQFSGWRGPGRTGIYNETGLMKSWPEKGPSMIWINEELPSGFSSVSFGSNTIYITGNTGNNGANDILVALNMDGKILWQTEMGRAWTGSNPESRATPTVEGNRVYTCSGIGDLASIDATTGKVIWSYKASEMNKGTYGAWGIAESLLIDDNKIYFSPGGPETMTIAINKATGDVVWKSASLGDKPGYVSPILINYAGKKMIVNVSLGHVYGVDASNGEILWKVSHGQKGGPDMSGRDLIKCTTPLYKDGMVYVTGGYNTGGMMVKIADDGKSAKVAWTDSILDNHHGGVVLINGYIYGSNWLNNNDGNWCCIEWNTGKKKYEEHWKCKGSIISDEGLLYLYDERSGYVGLVKANPEKFELISSFKITKGSGPYWAHPVIHNGKLYIRHGKALMVFNIKSDTY